MPSGVYTRTKPRPAEVRRRISESLKGRTSPMKGREQSLEARAKIGEANRGRTPYQMTEEIKQKIAVTKTGKPLTIEHRAKIAASSKRSAENPRWKGNRTERQTAHHRVEYKQWRDAVFHRDNFTCQLCDQYNGYLHADHIKTWAEYPTLRYDVNNGRTLCRACHFYITFKHKMKTTSRWGLTKQEQ